MTSLVARTAAYAMGDAYYNAYRPQHPGLAVPGYILGYENIYQDLGTITDCNASWLRRGLAAGDAAFNTILGITMLSGLRQSAQSFRLGWALRDISVADRLPFLQRLAAKSQVLIEESARGMSYRPPGEQVIQLTRATLNGSPWRLAGSFYHELAHVQQEFGIFGRVAKPLQWVSTKLEKPAGLPFYPFNPVEVHAFSSGLAFLKENGGYLLYDRLVLYGFNRLINGR